MILKIGSKAKEDLKYWQKNDKGTLKKITKLLDAILEDPYEGIGKPEPLKHSLSGYWSRRIDKKHRIVYKVEGDELIIIQCRFHY